MTQERTPVSPELEELLRKPDTRSPEEAAEADTRKVFERYGKELQAIIAEAVAGDIAAAREAGRLEGDAAGYRRAALEILQVIREMSAAKTFDELRIAMKIESAIRAKLEGK